jgi:hypothetical protein
MVSIGGDVEIGTSEREKKKKKNMSKGIRMLK